MGGCGVGGEGGGRWGEFSNTEFQTLCQNFNVRINTEFQTLYQNFNVRIGTTAAESPGVTVI